MFKTGAKATGEKDRDYWRTPTWLLDLVNVFYQDTGWFDPCPPGPTFDGLKINWQLPVYVNCPFSQFLAWAQHGTQQEVEQIWICHHAHDRKWFRLLTNKSSAMILLKERVRFIDPKTGLQKATMPGACQSLFYIGHRPKEFLQTFGDRALVSMTLKQPTGVN